MKKVSISYRIFFMLLFTSLAQDSYAMMTWLKGVWEAIDKDNGRIYQYEIEADYEAAEKYGTLFGLFTKRPVTETSPQNDKKSSKDTTEDTVKDAVKKDTPSSASKNSPKSDIPNKASDNLNVPVADEDDVFGIFKQSSPSSSPPSSPKIDPLIEDLLKFPETGPVQK